MLFTQHKVDPAHASRRSTQLAASLLKRTGEPDFVGHALGVFSRRLQRDPQDYLRTGPYWPALRALLHAAGHDVSDEREPAIEAEYSGATPAETIVMAEIFRDEQMATAVGFTRAYALRDGSAPAWVLFDAFQESKAR